jgi:hypothetical protein
MPDRFRVRFDAVEYRQGFIEVIGGIHPGLVNVDAELAEFEKRPASERGDVLKCHAAAQRAFQQAQTALTRHRTLIKAGPSPLDMLRPIAERWPAGKDRVSATRRAGDGVGARVG